MDKKVLYGVGAVVVVVVAVFFLMGKSTQVPVGSEGANQVAGSEEQLSLKDLMARSGSQKCTFAYEDESSRSSGVVYLADGKMRGDYESVVKASNETVKTYSISDGVYMYTWGSQMPQGVKMKVADFATQSGTPEAQKQNPVNYDQKVKTVCGGWSPDATVFAPPANVEFMDLGALMQGLGGLPQAPGAGAGVAPKMPAGSPAGQCAVCDEIPDADGKAQCRVALGCSR